MSNITIDVKNDAMLGRMNDKALHITLIEQQNEIERLHSIIKETRECINHYAIENEDYSKIYNDEEKELLEILDKVGDEV